MRYRLRSQVASLQRDPAVSHSRDPQDSPLYSLLGSRLRNPQDNHQGSRRCNLCHDPQADQVTSPRSNPFASPLLSLPRSPTVIPLRSRPDNQQCSLQDNPAGSLVASPRPNLS